MPEWMPIETAPRDGTWVLIEGEMAGGDTSSVRVGRYEPRTFQIGSQALEYEWRVVDESFAGFDETAQPKFNWYCEGRVSGWMPLPSPPESV